MSLMFWRQRRKGPDIIIWRYDNVGFHTAILKKYGFGEDIVCRVISWQDRHEAGLHLALVLPQWGGRPSYVIIYRLEERDARSWHATEVIQFQRKAVCHA